MSRSLNEGLPDQEERRQSSRTSARTSTSPQRRAPRSRGATVSPRHVEIVDLKPQRRAPRSRGATASCRADPVLSLEASTKGSPIKRSDIHSLARGSIALEPQRRAPRSRGATIVPLARPLLPDEPQRRAPRSRGATASVGRWHVRKARRLNEGLPDQEERQRASDRMG